MAAVNRMGTTDIVVAGESPNVTAILPAVRSRISWGAVLAGVVIAVILQIAMNMLGLSIGTAAIDPDGANALAPSFGIITVLWIAGSVLLSMFVGGAVAGYMSGRVGRNEGMIHGLTVWAVSTILSLILLTSAAGTVVNGVTSVIGQGLNLLGSAAADVVPGVADSVNLQESLMQSIRDEAGAIQPTTTNEASTDTSTGAESDNGSTSAASPRSINAPLIMAIGDLFAADEASPEAETARQSAITLISDTGVSEDEATATVARWENDYRAVIADAEVRAEQAAEDIANAIAATAGIAFMMIALGALAAGAGGFLSAPQSLTDVTASRREYPAN